MEEQAPAQSRAESRVTNGDSRVPLSRSPARASAALIGGGNCGSSAHSLLPLGPPLSPLLPALQQHSVCTPVAWWTLVLVVAVVVVVVRFSDFAGSQKSRVYELSGRWFPLAGTGWFPLCKYVCVCIQARLQHKLNRIKSAQDSN